MKKEEENRKLSAAESNLTNRNLPPFPESLPGEPFGDSSLVVSPIPGFPQVQQKDVDEVMYTVGEFASSTISYTEGLFK